jgi:hypothetical protein
MCAVKSHWFQLLVISCSWFLSTGCTTPEIGKDSLKSQGASLVSGRSLSNDCTGLVPDVIPEPRTKCIGVDVYTHCLRPTSSRSGILAFGTMNGFESPFSTYRLCTADGQEVGAFSEGGYTTEVFAPSDTFQITRFRYSYGTRPPPNPTLVSRTDHGERIDSYELDPESMDSPDSTYLAASDLVGGGIFAVYLRIRPNGWQLEGWRFDYLGTVLFGPVVTAAGEQSPQSIHFSPGVDVNRNSVLMFQSDVSQPATAIWFDLTGAILATRDFQVGDLWSYRGRTPLVPLLDGSFVLRAQGSGSLRIPAWDEAGDVGPAPQWIEDHPLTDLYFIRGMSGYALAPGDFWRECEREISIFAPDGTFCGSFAPEPTTFCAAMAIGQDGTVFHPTADKAPPCPPVYNSCSQHYWVGLLR